ncbi:MAG: hypothetical protein JF616_12980 [Fibrobacteres bacterium]|nr:hypothetical protein [Fibrobacterota bacterium]
MNSSCFVKSLCFAAATAWSAHADILPPDSHLVPRTVTIVNTGDYPALAFSALEFFPGNETTPVATTRMGTGVQAKITGYKLDEIDFYAAEASDTSAKVMIQGKVEAQSQWVSNTSTLISETYEYQLEGASAEKVALHAILQTHQDGSKQEVAPGATALRAPVAAAPMARLAADGRALIWVPQHSGIASVSLFDAGGRRAWAQHRVAVSGEAQILALPAMAAGRYLVSAQGRGWTQSARLDLGKR